jgi:5,5'-dehydrodivanillate O-demethylase oxygenase subunit
LRENEHLARSDLGISMFREQLRRDMAAVARGEDPKGVVREVAKNDPIHWPDDRSTRLTAGYPRERLLRRRAERNGLIGDDYFVFLAGQPPEVRKEYEEAMGL